MSQRSLVITLLVSAALNVFLVGSGVGLWASGGLGHHGGPDALRAQADRLEPANRAAFAALIHDQVQANGPLLLDARTSRRAARKLMLAQPFDAAAVSAALARARADDLQVRAHMEDAVVGFAAKLSPSERVKLSDGIARAGQRRDMLRRFGLGHH